MTMRSLALAALLAFALVAVPTALAQQNAGTPDPGITDGSKQRRLDAARTAWKAAGVRSYRFTIERQCFCPPLSDTTVVRGGLLRPGMETELRDVATVPRLFRLIQRWIDRKAVRVSVTYGERGVPSSISVDVSRHIADEEIGYAIRRFTRLRSRAR